MVSMAMGIKAHITKSNQKSFVGIIVKPSSFKAAREPDNENLHGTSVNKRILILTPSDHFELI